MFSRFFRHWSSVNYLNLLIVFWVLIIAGQAQAAPTIVSTVPTIGAGNISPSAAVVFTFSEPMETNLTTAEFLDIATFTPLPTSPTWSAGNTVLTCTPTPAFPINKLIFWSVTGENPAGDVVEGDVSGYFTTGSSGGGTGSGTNALTEFSVGKVHSYVQTSTAAPVLDSETPYGFVATTILASNRSANSVTLTLPNNNVSNLLQIIFRPELFTLFSTKTNLAQFDTTFGTGNYVFNVQAPNSNQMVTVNLAASLAQPPAPRANNFPATQSVDPSQAFQLGWDSFAGGTAADYIHVNVAGVYRSPDIGAPGALNGTATSFIIPANTLESGTNYEVTIGFYKYLYTSNVTYTTTAFRATSTTFTLLTTGGTPTTPLVLTNYGFSGANFNLEVTSAAGQTLTVLYKNNLSPGSWQTLLTTNSPGGRVRVTYPNAATNQTLFFRARTGS